MHQSGASETPNQGLGLIYCIGHFDQAKLACLRVKASLKMKLNKVE